MTPIGRFLVTREVNQWRNFSISVVTCLLNICMSCISGISIPTCLARILIWTVSWSTSIVTIIPAEVQAKKLLYCFTLRIRSLHHSSKRLWRQRNTNTFIITFNLPSVPKYLKIGFIRVSVSVYIPNPLRYYKCQRFGHGKTTCKGTTTCATCG